MRLTPDIRYSPGPESSISDPLFLDLFAPKDRPSLGAILFAHGGSFRRGGRKSPYINRLAAFLTDLGYAFASVSYRLNTQPEVFSPDDQKRISANSEASIASGISMSPRLFGPAMMAAVEDCSTAIGFLRENAADLRINSSKIGVIGVSAGGIAGVALAYPPPDWSRPLNAPDRVVTIGGGVVYPWSLSANGPPVLMFHGRRDRVIAVDNIRTALKAAQAKNAPFEFVISPGTAHLDQPEFVLSGLGKDGTPLSEKLTIFLQPLQSPL